ncbi:MAG: hypothetical protein QME88_09610 [Actinomycetota bacterium]|nr:hypothetical protein [Actinomycetota bacterium]
MKGRARRTSVLFAAALMALAAVGALVLLPSPVARASPGTRVKTVEYALGQRFDPNPLAAGAAWSPGTTQVWLPEAGVSVFRAWLDLHVQAPATPPSDVSSISVLLNGQEYSPVSGRFTTQSGESCILWVSADVTAAFSSFSNPFSATPAVTVNGATSQGHSLKLYITYTYDDQSPVQLKTVRYPLASNTAALAANSTYSVNYNAYIPESGVTVRSQWFEVTGQAHNANSATDSYLTASIGGGPSTPAAYVEMAERDTMDIRFLMQPSGFTPNAAQTLNLTAGGQAFYVLGGELAITYEYDPASTEQLKTVSYFMGQTAGGNTTAASYSRNIYLPENGIRARGLWLHLRANTSGTITHRVLGYVAGASAGQRSYAITAGQENIGEHRIIYDMAAQAPRLTNGAVLRADTWYSTAAGGPCGIEAFITYSYNSSSDFDLRSVSFLTGQSADGLSASSAQSFSTLMPESGTRTSRSAYLICFIVSSATAPYAHAVNINGTGPSSVTMASTGEASSSSRLYEAAQMGADSATYTAAYSSDSNAAWTGRAVVTYEIELAGPASQPQSEIKTVEYCLGQRLDAANLAAGTAWQPGSTTVYFPEDGVVVRQAWLEFRAQAPSDVAADVTSVECSVNGRAFPCIPDVGFTQTGESGIIWVKANITRLFSGVGAGLELNPSVTVNGANSQGHSLKAVITYECASSSAVMQKTVRYPLASRTGSLAAGSTASYAYTAAAPEAGVNIRSQWFEIKGQAFNGAATDSYLYANIDGGPNTGSAYVEMALRDSMDVLFYFQPAGFALNTAQTLNLTAGGQRFHVLGGELVVTYDCDGASAEQVKTIGYYLGANNASTVPVTFTRNVYLPESGVSVERVWAQVRGNVSASIGQGVSGSIAGNAVPQLSYSLTASTENIGEHRIIYDMSSQAGALANGSAVSVSTWYSGAGGGAFGVELFFTYRFARESSLTQARTVQFWVGQSNSARSAAGVFHFRTWMPETNKTGRSAWLESFIVSRAVTGYTHVLDINGSGSSSLTMANTGEANSSSRLYEASQVTTDGSAYTCNASSASTCCFSVKAYVTYESLVPTVSLAIEGLYDLDGEPSQHGEMRFMDVDPITGTYIIGDGEPYAVRLRVRSNVNWQVLVHATSDFTDGEHTIPIGRLSFSDHAAGNWRGFSTVAAAVTGTQPPTGTEGTALDLDYRLEVLWEDEPGGYFTTIVYTVISL